jgi:hypothetical protein
MPVGALKSSGCCVALAQNRQWSAAALQCYQKQLFAPSQGGQRSTLLSSRRRKPADPTSFAEVSHVPRRSMGERGDVQMAGDRLTDVGEARATAE